MTKVSLIPLCGNAHMEVAIHMLVKVCYFPISPKSCSGCLMLYHFPRSLYPVGTL